jgi:small subunit ribosomal protein S21
MFTTEDDHQERGGGESLLFWETLFFKRRKWYKSAFLKLKRGWVQVFVRDNNVDQALRTLKKKMQREGIFRELKLRKHFEKPSERRVREQAESRRRLRKLARKRLEVVGF